MVKKKESIVFLFLLALSVILVLVYNNIKKTNKEIYERVEKHEIAQISTIIHNIEQYILDSYDIRDSQKLFTVLSDEVIRNHHEKHIMLMMSSNIKYAYILYKDEKGKFRFLLDASKADKANFNQKFDVQNHEYFDIYKTKTPQIIKQKDIENLYLTYIFPIISDNEVIALFSVDITTDIQNSILNSIKPLENFFIILIVVVILFMVITILQLFHYFVTRKRVFTDPLTKTFNRNYLEELLLVVNLKDYSIAMLDLDKFKQINDTYGHQAGDYILVQASKIFKESIRASDILVRYGGEEFLLLIHNKNRDASALELCERIKKNIYNNTFLFDNHEIKVSVSIGLHKHPSLEKNLQEAIKLADQMLYMAKKNGRNRIEIYDEKAKNCDSTLSKDLLFVKEALNDDRVLCYYQPIYDHKVDEILKYEALVRIVTQEGKIIPPFEFLPQIKGTNMHYKLTQRILHIVFEKIKESEKEISININFSDLTNQDIEESIIKYLKRYPECAQRVTFEILESDEIDDVVLFKEKTAMLHTLGAKVSIDDFGSGYSNFKTVIDIEANYLKIDGSLIKNIDKNDKDYKVVKSIIHFAKNSDMQTVAEFVHSKEVYEKLIALDINYMQGYYISPPQATLVKSDEIFR